MESGHIKAINRNSVHKICSGQVVLTLATAVKELVENSIDAGATIIEVKLKEFGSEQIEVIDNGKGVKSCDFQSITLKHHTSKINDFCDVESVSTFGFRGEALSSLCALSNVEIITCHSDSTVGSLLIYDHDGVLIKNSPTHRQVGTTIILKNLFFTLPVRHKEFLRNIRREYTKMIQLLTAYCLISINRRITCTNTTDKGRKTVLLSTNCSETLKGNISCIFGSKQVNNLMEFVQHIPSESVLEEYFLAKSVIERCKIFRSTHGEGRSSTDRQFFFINGRPCDLPKISKLINEIYHSFNKAQYPFVFLNVALTEGSVDVNVTPDKRQVFIPDEKLLLCIVKSSLHQMYELQPSQMKISSASLFFQKNSSDVTSNEVHKELKEESLHLPEEDFMDDSLKRKVDSSRDSNEEDCPFSPPLKSFRKDGSSSLSVNKEEVVNDHFFDIQDSPDSGFSSAEKEFPSTLSTAELDESKYNISLQKGALEGSNVNIALTLPFNEEKAFRNSAHSRTGNLNLKDILEKARRGNGTSNYLVSNHAAKSNKQKSASNDKIVNYFLKKSPPKLRIHEMSRDPKPMKCSSLSNDCTFEMNEVEDRSHTEDHVLDEPHVRRKKTKIIPFSIESIKKSLEAKNKMNIGKNFAYRKFRSKIAPTDNQSAEEELKKEIRKENFSQMDIIGQFNLGFIIARLNDDLFIIDQHATDEKYNFEILQKETVLETQKLLNPQNLNLSAVSEAILLDNLPIFEKSGFKFNVDEDSSVGNKIQLISVPVSHNWRFGKEDVDEMIFMLTDNPISMIRPSRVNQMFASRACRKSIMIGTALTLPMMKKLVTHMGEIEQPWINSSADVLHDAKAWATEKVTTSNDFNGETATASKKIDVEYETEESNFFHKYDNCCSGLSDLMSCLKRRTCKSGSVSLVVNTDIYEFILRLPIECSTYETLRKWNKCNSVKNCPHGRPTMRHLFNLNLLRTTTDDETSLK